jgi:hypothetical protein
MILDFSKEGNVMVNMIEYIKTIISYFPEEIIATQASPAADHLFTVRDKSKATPLPEEQARVFHHATAPVLFLNARARRHIQPCTAFLTTCVKSPDKEDWGKLKRLLGYLKGTLHMTLVLLEDSLTLSCWWVDAAYAVHSDMKGHTGAGMSFGQGMALSYSWKHKIVTKSSTEAELVGVDDSLGHILWARYFMQAQGYEMKALLIYQDNMSAMLLKTNGKASSSKCTKYIKGKYFYIKHKINQGDIVVEHCPTKQMSDINTKPKQGAFFCKFRGHMMGIPVDYNNADYIDKVPLTPNVSMLPLTKEQLASQECVGEQESHNNPTKDRLDGSVQDTSSQPPIIMIGGRGWAQAYMGL